MSEEGATNAEEQRRNENAFLLTWLGLAGVILIQGILLAASVSQPDATVNLVLSLLGGKGRFGLLLREDELTKDTGGAGLQAPLAKTGQVEGGEKVKSFPSIKRMQDHPTKTAKNFTIDGHCSSVSFITSMTKHFCSSSNRLRLLADGNFKVCLFGPSEVSLRDPLRYGADDEVLREIIGAALCI